MDPLREWHEYVDRLSRPARRLVGDDPDERARYWRPWMESPEDETTSQAVMPERVPRLTPAIAIPGLAQARQQPVRGFEDPTLEDQLRPMRDFAVPELHVPAFELNIPRLGQASIVAQASACRGAVPIVAQASACGSAVPEGPASDLNLEGLP